MVQHAGPTDSDKCKNFWRTLNAKKKTRKDFSQRLVNEIKTETCTTCMPTMNLSRALRHRDRARTPL